MIKRSFVFLPSLNSAGYTLSIANYWAIINGSLQDYISGNTLTTTGAVALVPDRLGNALGSFQTPSNSYARAPASLYFASGSLRELVA
jgi:hypothetical protein